MEAAGVEKEEQLVQVGEKRAKGELEKAEAMEEEDKILARDDTKCL